MKASTFSIVYPNPVPHGVVLEKNVYATMRDGIKIALDVYRPAQGKGPWPVILAYSSFPKERIFESAKPGFYCAHGYVCVQASERGVGLNQGQFTFQGPTAARDGYDIIEWLAQQPWCNGNIAMMGASGYGVMQWITAELNPPHLKALVVLGTTDNYRGLCYPGGVLRRSFVQYLITNLVLGALWPGRIPGKKMPANIMASILAHNEDGPFWWNHGGSWKKISQIKAPILNIVQVPNRLHTIYHLRFYNDIRAPKKLLVSPWTNENYQPWIFETTAFNQYILRWLDYWLKGIDTGIMAEPEIAIYDNGTGKWYYAEEYPLARTQWTKYYLHQNRDADDGGVLNTLPPSDQEEPDIYHNISLNTALRESYGPYVNNTLLNKTISGPWFVTYVSAPLKEDLRIWGPVSLTLYAATEEEVTTDWSFFIKMGEMVPEGIPLNPVTGEPEAKPEITDADTPAAVQIWSWGSFKAKFRELDEKMSRPGMPWHTFRNPADLKPNTVYEFQIELQPIFKTFKKGCRIWMKIASDDALYSTRDRSSLYVEKPGIPVRSRIFIYHDKKHPSHLLLPIIPDAPDLVPPDIPLYNAIPGAPRFTGKSS